MNVTELHTRIEAMELARKHALLRTIDLITQLTIAKLALVDIQQNSTDDGAVMRAAEAINLLEQGRS